MQAVSHLSVTQMACKHLSLFHWATNTFLQPWGGLIPSLSSASSYWLCKRGKENPWEPFSRRLHFQSTLLHNNRWLHLGRPRRGKIMIGIPTGLFNPGLPWELPLVLGPSLSHAVVWEAWRWQILVLFLTTHQRRIWFFLSKNWSVWDLEIFQRCLCLNWELGKLGSSLKSTMRSPGLTRHIRAVLTLNKDLLTAITVAWVLSGSSVSLWGRMFEPSIWQRQGGMAPLNGPGAMRQRAGQVSPALYPLCYPHLLQLLPGGYCPKATVDREARLRDWSLLWSPTDQGAEKRFILTMSCFAINVINELEGKNHWLLVEKLCKQTMDEGKWCQHQHCSFGDQVSYLVLLWVIKNSQCFYNLQRVPNTVLITLLILTQLIFTQSLMKWVLLLTLFIDEKTEAVETFCGRYFSCTLLCGSHKNSLCSGHCSSI